MAMHCNSMNIVGYLKMLDMYLNCCACCHAFRDLSVDDAIELGRRAIYHATFRDCASGGTVSGEWAQADTISP